MSTRGKFFTFEGPEGCGKSTQIRLLADRLLAEGVETVVAREPGGTPTGELIREILQHDKTGEAISPRAEVLLFNASRAQLVDHLILPALERGACVLCDRFMDSTTAYQGFGRAFDLETVLAINAFAVGRAVPDATFLLDLDAEAGLKRIRARYEAGGAMDRIERERLAFHESVRRGYLELARRWPDRFHVIRAEDAIDAIHQTVWKKVCHVLGR